MPFHPSVRLRGLLAAVFLAAASSASAGGEAGDFDFYVLSLSWSPSWCATGDRPDPAQCGRPFGFIVHGLWPEYEQGYPDYCPSNMPRQVRRDTVDAIADIMPGAGLVNHEWQKHGVCSGLTQDGYFATLRRAFERIAMPAMFVRPKSDAAVSPRDIERAFVAANPRLVETGIAVTCDRGLLDEVRICLTKALDFRRCVEVDRRSCRAATVTVPAVAR